MNDLITKARGGDKKALKEIIDKYTPLVRSIAAKFFLWDGDGEDLVQEGLVGLFSAINGYDVYSETNFATYAYVCARNAILDAVKKSNGIKNSALNGFVPIVEISDFPAPENPESEIILRENRGEFLQKISKLLSPFEFKALVLYLDGLSSAEIGQTLDKSAKSADNALNRAKNKLYKLYSED